MEAYDNEREQELNHGADDTPYQEWLKKQEKMERNFYNNPTGKPYCCYRDCSKDATKEIRYSNEPEDYTHSCDEHLENLSSGSIDITDL